jgi:hypothetical protein
MTDGSVCSLRTAYRLPALGVIHLSKIQFFLWNINRKRGRAERTEESYPKVIFCFPGSRVVSLHLLFWNVNRKREKGLKRSSKGDTQMSSFVFCIPESRNCWFPVMLIGKRRRRRTQEIEERNSKILFSISETRNCWFPVTLIGRGKRLIQTIKSKSK